MSEIINKRTRDMGKQVDEIIQSLFSIPLYTVIEIKPSIEYRDDEKYKKELIMWVKKRVSREFPDGGINFVDNVLMYPNYITVAYRDKDRAMEYRKEHIEHYLDFIKNAPHADTTGLLEFNNRVNGLSTRQCDNYIQAFFDLKDGDSIEIIDHYGSPQANHCLLDKICGRLEDEYHVRFKVSKGRRVPKLIRADKFDISSKDIENILNE